MLQKKGMKMKWPLQWEMWDRWHAILLEWLNLNNRKSCRLSFFFLALLRWPFHSSELFLGFGIKQRVAPKSVESSVQMEQKTSDTSPSCGSLLHHVSCCGIYSSLARGHRQMSEAFSSRQCTPQKLLQISQMKIESWCCAKPENESDETGAQSNDDKVTELLPSERQPWIPLMGFCAFRSLTAALNSVTWLEQFSIYVDRQLGRFTSLESRWPGMTFSERQLSFPSQICCTVSSTSCYINSAQSVGEILQQVPEEGMLNNVNLFFFFYPTSVKSGGFCHGLL